MNEWWKKECRQLIRTCVLLHCHIHVTLLSCWLMFCFVLLSFTFEKSIKTLLKKQKQTKTCVCHVLDDGHRTDVNFLLAPQGSCILPRNKFSCYLLRGTCSWTRARTVEPGFPMLSALPLLGDWLEGRAGHTSSLPSFGIGTLRSLAPPPPTAAHTADTSSCDHRCDGSAALAATANQIIDPAGPGTHTQTSVYNKCADPARFLHLLRFIRAELRCLQRKCSKWSQAAALGDPEVRARRVRGVLTSRKHTSHLINRPRRARKFGAAHATQTHTPTHTQAWKVKWFIAC